MQGHPSYNYSPQSGNVYQKHFDALIDYMTEHGIESFDVGLRSCFEEWSNQYRASTLSTRLSGIKGIMLKNGIPFSDHTIIYIQKCISNMERSSSPAKQASPFTLDDVQKYLGYDHSNKADVLLKKVILIVGVFCLLRGNELRQLCRNDLTVFDCIAIHI